MPSKITSLQRFQEKETLQNLGSREIVTAAFWSRFDHNLHNSKGAKCHQILFVTSDPESSQHETINVLE